MEVEKDNKDFTVHPDGSITVDEIVIPPPPVPALTVKSNNERLIITELITRDFKSFAGTCVIGPFNKDLSCIVGSHWSDKSNVNDALLFVFGYRAQKIRSKKVSVLIHNSHKLPNLPSCSVTVNFATIDQFYDYTILPKICVTRTGYRDNSSTYEVNGRRSQYKDVAILLRKYGIDLDYNRFMILQGEIELISMMKPKAPSEQEAGMLEYIEDIIGSNRFIQPIQHFSTKVEETNEIRIEKLNQLKIIEKERADAEKPRNEAMEYLRLANEVALMQNSILQTNIRLHMYEHEKVAKVVEEYNQQFSKLEREDVACRENMKSNKEKIKKLNKSLETEESKISKLELHDIGEGETELPVLSPEELDDVATSSLQYEVGRIQSKMKDMKVDLSSIAEFKKKEEIYKRKLQDLESTVAERDRYRSHYEALRRQRLQEFLRGFSIITLKVKELYQKITFGGDAELELVNSVDPFSEGIEFSVRPWRKTWKSIRNLSGVEKTLSSLSLVFALHFYRTTSFFVMDKIEAPLDSRNYYIIDSYIKKCTKNAQFIVISLSEDLLTEDNHLLGIYKTINRTKNVFVNWPPAEEEVAFDKLLSQETNTAKTTTALKETNKIDTAITDINITSKTPKKKSTNFWNRVSGWMMTILSSEHPPFWAKGRHLKKME